MHLFDDGYEKLRERIFENQKRLGVIPKDSKLTPWPKDILKPWDELTPGRRSCPSARSRSSLLMRLMVTTRLAALRVFGFSQSLGLQLTLRQHRHAGAQQLRRRTFG